MTSMSMSYPAPSTPEDFESLCLRLFRRHWNSNDLQKFGRRGHSQAGCDARGTDCQGRMCGLQCKLRDFHKVLTREEIAAEIALAKQATPPLERFAIATSAKRDPSLQQYVLEQNRELEAQGLFSLELHSWDDLNELLNEYPDVAKPIYLAGGPLQASGPKTPSIEASTVGSSASLAQGEPSDIHAEIDEAGGYLKQHEPQMAILLLHRTAKRHGGRFTPRCRYRVHANLGHAHIQLNEPSRAAEEYLTAADAQPEDPDGRWLRAYAFLIRKDLPSSHEAAASLIADHPEHTKAKIAWIESLPEGTALEAALDGIPAHQRSNGEIAAALARLASRLDRLENAEGFARAAVQAEPDWVESRMLLAEILIRRAEALASRVKVPSGSPQPDALAREAADLLAGAIDEMQSHKLPDVLPQLWCNLAAAHWVLKNRQQSEECILRASAERITNPNVALACARFFHLTGRTDQAIGAIQSIVAPRPPELDLVLAQLMAQRNQGHDRCDARQLLSARLDQAMQQGPELAAAWLETFIKLCIAAGDLNKATELVEGLSVDEANAVQALLLRAHITDAQGHRDQAVVLVRQAASNISDSIDRPTARELARQCEGLQLLPEAISIWRMIASPTVPDESWEHLVACAQRAKRWDIITGFCASLRAAGILDERFLRAEVGAWERVSPLRTYELLGDLEQQVHEEKLCRELHAHRLFLGNALGVQGIPQLTANEAPRITELSDARIGRVVVDLLRISSSPIDGVKYAYQLFRQFPDDLDAWMAVMLSINLERSPPVTLPQHARVELGTAVQYVEDDTQHREWVVIADEASPSSSLQERRPDDPVVQHMLGKKKGEQFEIRSAPKPARTATILAIQSKYEYRCRYCWENMERRFGSESPVFAFHLPHDQAGKPDMSVFLEQVKGVFAHEDEALQTYEQLPIPVHVLSAAHGKTAFEGVRFLASGAGGGLKCVLGSREEMQAADAAIRVAKAFVLDETALATLYLLQRGNTIRVADLLPSVPQELIVSEFAIAEVKQENEHKWGSARERKFLGVAGGRVVLQEVSADVVEKEREALARFIQEVETRCRVAASTSEQATEVTNAEVMTRAFGRSGLHAMQVARSPGHLLWTDDLIMGMIASSEWSVRRVWTQTVLGWLSGRGHISVEAEEQATLQMLMMGYRFTSIGARHFQRAGVISGWKVDDNPLKRLLDEFANPAVELSSLARLLGECLVTLWRSAVLDMTCQAVTVRLLERTAQRPGGYDLITQIHDGVDLIFGFDPVNAQRVKRVIGGWLRSQRHIILP